MAMPLDLILVRHGQSEQNLASHLAKAGDDSLYTKEFRDRHVSQHRLTAKGGKQAELAGDWLRQNSLGRCDRRYVSAYVRAIETAALLKLEGPDWIVEPMLREREWGDFDQKTWEERMLLSAQSMRSRDTDPFYWVPPNGESIAQLTVRLRPLLGTLHRECADKKVVIVCHGEVMWAWRFVLERMSVQRWAELERSKEPGVKIFNCQILHYTRRNPKTGMLSDHLDWMRSVSPADMTNSGTGWKDIVRKRFSNEDLLAIAEEVPMLFPDQEGY